MAAPSDMDRLLTSQQVADLFGVRLSTVRAWTFERRLPCVKLRGRLVRFRASEIEKIIKADTRPALRGLAGD